MGRKLDLGKIMITTEDEWSENRSYEILSAVHYDGSGYIAIRDNTGVRPGTDESVWMLFAAKGEAPELTLDASGNLYADGEFLSSALADIIRHDNEVTGNEAARKVAETDRLSAEADRKSSEDERKVAENLRITAEKSRSAAEDARKLTEQQRISNESSRTLAESNRKLNEQSRIATENERKANEDARKVNESARIKQEASRVEVEAARVSTEKARVAAEESRVKVEAARVEAEKFRVNVETSRVAAEESRVAAEKARVTETNETITNCNAAKDAANAAAKAATEAKEAIEQDSAVVKTSAQELTDEQMTQARENIGAEFLHRALGKYNAIGERTLSVGTSGKYIDVNGNEVSNSAYAISEPISLNKGDDLLIPSASPVAAEVSIVSRKVTNTYDEPIIYDIAYADDGKIATATAQYDKTLVYTAVYEDDTLTGWTMGGTSYDSLPATYSVTRSFYVPLVNQSVAAMPDTGYYVFPADEAMEVVISAFTATVSGGVCKVYGVGLVKNYATNMVGQTKQHVLAEVIAAMAAKIDALESMLAGEIGHLSVRDLQVGRTLRGINLDGGFALQAAGTPAADLVPSNWDFDTYGDWTGAPQFIGQLYIDTANKIVYIGVGVESISDWVRISNA